MSKPVYLMVGVGVSIALVACVAGFGIKSVWDHESKVKQEAQKQKQIEKEKQDEAAQKQDEIAEQKAAKKRERELIWAKEREIDERKAEAARQSLTAWAIREENKRQAEIRADASLTIQDRLEAGREACLAGDLVAARASFAKGILQCDDTKSTTVYAMRAEFALRIFLLTGENQWLEQFSRDMALAGFGANGAASKRNQISKDHQSLLKKK